MPDPERSWVRLDELNVFAWPCYDLRFVPGTDRTDYGLLPQPIFERIRQGLQLSTAGAACDRSTVTDARALQGTS